MAERPLILLSNDDGVHAPGIVELRKVLLEIATVVTVAPETEQSATGHGITLHRPVRYRRLGPDLHALDGTPVDCVYVALHLSDLLPRRPDLVVSGINHGPNLGMDVFYSGTVAAAREGALRGIASIAFSRNGEGDMKESAALCRGIVERMLAAVKPAGDTVLLNVNLPAGHPRGIRVTRLGRRHYVEGVDKREDPRGRSYLWIGGPYSAHHEPIEGSDTEAIDEGHASITPLLLRAENPDHVGLAAFVAGPAEAP